MMQPVQDSTQADEIQHERNKRPQLTKKQKSWNFLKWAFSVIGHAFTDSLLTATAWPILASIILNKALEDETLNETDRILIVSMILPVFVLSNFFIQYNLIAARSDGEADIVIEPRVFRQSLNIQNPARNLRLGVAATYLSAMTEALDGFLTGLASHPAPDGSGAFYGALAFGAILAAINGCRFLVVDAAGAWEKLVERHPQFRALPLQHGMEWFFKRARFLAIGLREIYPSGMAAIHVYCVEQFIALMMGLEDLSLLEQIPAFGPHLAWIAPLLSMIYLGGAFTNTQFDMRKMVEAVNIATTNTPVDFENRLSQSNYTVLRGLGRIQSGQALFDLISIFRRSPETTAKITSWVAAIFNAAGLAALVERGLREYFGSQNIAKIQLGDEGTLTRFITGSTESTAAAGVYMAPVQDALAIAAATAQSYGKRATMADECIRQTMRDTDRASARVVDSARQPLLNQPPTRQTKRESATNAPLASMDSHTYALGSGAPQYIHSS